MCAVQTHAQGFPKPAEPPHSHSNGLKALAASLGRLAAREAAEAAVASVQDAAPVAQP